MTAPLWKGEDVLTAIGGEGRADWIATGVSIDSRSVKPGDLFIALRGPNRDGAAFVADALKRGAAAAAVPWGAPIAEDPRIIRVGNGLGALTALADAARDRATGKVVAVTGSVGKTTTKAMLGLALTAAGAKVSVAEASYNNHWGVPLSLARAPADADIIVLELGMNRPGEIANLSRLARPHAVMITRVAPAHLRGVGSLEGVARAKAEIGEGALPDAICVLHADSPHQDILLATARQQGLARPILFGDAEQACARMLEWHATGCGSQARVRIGKQELAFTLSLAGRFNAMNALGALAMIDALGYALAPAAAALAPLRPLPGRGARTWVRLASGARALVVDETHNANPASMVAALEALAALPTPDGGRRWVLLGDMAELDASAEARHAALATTIAKLRLDGVFACGGLSRALYDALPERLRCGWAQEPESLGRLALARLRAGDVVMAKGSKASGMAQAVRVLTTTADEAASC